MKEKTVLRWIATAAMVGAFVNVFASDRVEPNAFLNTRAGSVSQLVRELKTDSAVADRYQRHFGKSKEELVNYFSTLHLAKLNGSGTYMIYSVDDQGIIKAHPERLKAGTLVFADNAGTPILKASCGNALVSGSNLLAVSPSPEVSGSSTSLHQLPATTPTAAMEDVDQMVALTPGSPVAVQPIIPEQVSTGTGNQGFALPAALAAIGGAGAVFLGGGGSTPVPEPASMIVLGTAVGAIVLRRRSKKN